MVTSGGGHSDRIARLRQGDKISRSFLGLSGMLLCGDYVQFVYFSACKHVNPIKCKKGGGSGDNDRVAEQTHHIS